ncbi:DAK2 domain-containing protein [Bailinhaonella thermotolerans]|uniref:DAK2 domain-containing protein n=1 Tax=Bailinhaonella thermotolerans TaxID=1070861 RepID=A0A3A4AAT7_9ACTN|nr:DAK2 domain-containing protein [Bailinhaonella thermotolerans]RJL25209.1 DAK2 domain-containing protein [Bailinhaonella thermotolerans]
MLDVLDARAVRRWCRLSADALGRARADIDALNVFPVPDGDTGTNLHLTLLSAAEALDALPPGAGAGETWRTLARGALLGARGNSGVIVSQAFRGLADALGGVERIGPGELCRGLIRAADLARAAVARPVEGTVLSVLSSAADAVRHEPGDLASVARAAAEGARDALRRTPDQLPVLAKNGVVDAGGAGLAIVLDALLSVVTDSYPEHYDVPRPRSRVAPEPEPDGDQAYEVMYLLDAGDDAVAALRAELDRLGDSLVVIGGDGLWNIHVHVDDAGAAIEAGIRAGRPHRVRVTHLASAARTHRAGGGRGVVAVAAGDGLAALFERAGAVVVRREPGSSPPLAMVLDAVRRAGNEVAILPNDTGVRAVAEAAAEVAREEGLTVSVLPTRASVQGLAALAVHDPLRRFDDDVVAMTDAAGHTRAGQLTIAPREAVTSAGMCHPGDVLGLIDGDVALIGALLHEVAVEIVDRMLSGGGELVTLVIGADAPPDLEAAVTSHLARTRPDVEVAVYEGGQGGYPLLIGVE